MVKVYAERGGWDDFYAKKQEAIIKERDWKPERAKTKDSAANTIKGT